MLNLLRVIFGHPFLVGCGLLKVRFVDAQPSSNELSVVSR
ncbi:hypothetical protein V6Z11_D01G122100 [Gossypium hirsutum]